MSVGMTHVAALLSMLHEPAAGNSAVRRFRNQPVLRWTLSRLARCKAIDTITVLCWDDQAGDVAGAMAASDPDVVGLEAVGPRRAMPAMEALSTARRWADGWRGGLLGSCDFDLGFDAESAARVAAKHEADGLLLVDPAAGLVDPVLIEDLLAHAENHPEAELVFSPAAPGLSGVLLRRALVDRLTVARIHPGRLLTYWPDQHGVDPIGKNGCAAVPTAVARTTNRFKLDSDRQLTRIDAATAGLNGQLMVTEAEGLVARMSGMSPADDTLPRDVVLEVGTARLSRPIYWPGEALRVRRADLSVETAKILFQELAELDDLRLTLAGVGDPLCAANFQPIIAAARAAGVSAISVETDLLSADASAIEALASSGVDVVSVHVPAATAATYARMMNLDGFGRAMGNLRLLEMAIAGRAGNRPLIVPTFTKTGANLAEMDCWYDYWIRRLGHAVILGPSDFAGQMVDVAVADMAPPRRRACGRLWSRLSILCDGRVVSCEQDVLGRQTLGTIGEMSLKQMWKERFGALRGCHRVGAWDRQPLCGTCREWHRP